MRAVEIADTKSYANNAANKVREAFILFGKTKKCGPRKKAGKLVVSFLFYSFI